MESWGGGRSSRCHPRPLLCLRAFSTSRGVTRSAALDLAPPGPSPGPLTAKIPRPPVPRAPTPRSPRNGRAPAGRPRTIATRRRRRPPPGQRCGPPSARGGGRGVVQRPPRRRRRGRSATGRLPLDLGIARPSSSDGCTHGCGGIVLPIAPKRQPRQGSRTVQPSPVTGEGCGGVGGMGSKRRRRRRSSGGARWSVVSRHAQPSPGIGSSSQSRQALRPSPPPRRRRAQTPPARPASLPGGA